LLAKREVQGPNVEQVLSNPTSICGPRERHNRPLLARRPQSATAQSQSTYSYACAFQKLPARQPGAMPGSRHDQLFLKKDIFCLLFLDISFLWVCPAEFLLFSLVLRISRPD